MVRDLPQDEPEVLEATQEDRSGITALNLFELLRVDYNVNTLLRI